jgi:predicted amidophosphoribosyltransferase
MANIKDCFSCSQPELITGKNIILIDDVSTSGATLLEATKTLRAHHPRHIIGLVIAKVD